MAKCACDPDNDGKAKCLCARRLEVKLLPSAKADCPLRVLSATLYSGRREDKVRSSSSTTLTLYDASAFASEPDEGETKIPLVAMAGRGATPGAYTGRTDNTLTGVTDLGSLPAETAVKSPEGPVKEFSGTASITSTNNVVTPGTFVMQQGVGECLISIPTDSKVNIQVKVTYEDVDYTGSVTVSGRTCLGEPCAECSIVTPRCFLGVLSGLTICGGCYYAVNLRWIKITSVSIRSTFILTQDPINPCRWIANIGTVRVHFYEDDDTCSEEVSSWNYEVTAELNYEAGGWYVCIYSGSSICLFADDATATGECGVQLSFTNDQQGSGRCTQGGLCGSCIPADSAGAYGGTVTLTACNA